MVPIRWDAETAGGPSGQAGMDERLAQLAIVELKGLVLYFVKREGAINSTISPNLF